MSELRKLNFKFKCIKPKAKPSANTLSVIKEKITGEVVKIDNDFRVKHEDKLYPITERSYDTKGKKVIYSRKPVIHNGSEYYNKIIRNNDNLSFMGNSDIYIPFRPNKSVKGNIVSVKGVAYFDILNTIEENKL